MAAEIARAKRAHDLARSEAEAGIDLADTCGFGHSSVELRLAPARARLDAGEAKAALVRAREVLDRWPESIRLTHRGGSRNGVPAHGNRLAPGQATQAFAQLFQQ